MPEIPSLTVPDGATASPTQQSGSIRTKATKLKTPETTREAQARTMRSVLADRDAALSPKTYVHESDGRPLAKLPADLGAIDVYADTPEYALWVHLVIVRDWLQSFSADLHGLRMNAQQAVERLDSFLADTAIPGHLRRNTGDRRKRTVNPS